MKRLPESLYIPLQSGEGWEQVRDRDLDGHPAGDDASLRPCFFFFFCLLLIYLDRGLSLLPQHKPRGQ